MFHFPVYLNIVAVVWQVYYSMIRVEYKPIKCVVEHIGRERCRTSK